MTFPVNVERWRERANAAINAVLTDFPARKSLLDTLGITNAGLSDIILALIQKESSGNPEAFGDNGNSVGLMQLNYGAGTPQALGYKGDKASLRSPDLNLYYGTAYFLDRLNRYKDRDKAILAYNAGSFRLNQAGEPINLAYLDNVLKFLGEKKTSRFRQARSV